MTYQDDVIVELEPLGKYRVRLLRGKSGPVLDIREYVKDEKFEGFTRRGIRLTSGNDIEMLEVVAGEAFAEWMKASAPERVAESPGASKNVTDYSADVRPDVETQG